MIDRQKSDPRVPPRSADRHKRRRQVAAEHRRARELRDRELVAGEFRLFRSFVVLRMMRTPEIEVRRAAAGLLDLWDDWMAMKSGAGEQQGAARCRAPQPTLQRSMTAARGERG